VATPVVSSRASKGALGRPQALFWLFLAMAQIPKYKQESDLRKRSGQKEQNGFYEERFFSTGVCESEQEWFISSGGL
jgi:hypothetical protein